MPGSAALHHVLLFVCSSVRICSPKFYYLGTDTFTLHRKPTYLHGHCQTIDIRTTSLPRGIEISNTSRLLQLALSPTLSFPVAVENANRASSLGEGRDATWKVRRSRLPKRSLWTHTRHTRRRRTKRRYFWKLSRPRSGRAIFPLSSSGNDESTWCVTDRERPALPSLFPPSLLARRVSRHTAQAPPPPQMPLPLSAGVSF